MQDAAEIVNLLELPSCRSVHTLLLVNKIAARGKIVVIATAAETNAHCFNHYDMDSVPAAVAVNSRPQQQQQTSLLAMGHKAVWNVRYKATSKELSEKRQTILGRYNILSNQNKFRTPTHRHYLFQSLPWYKNL